MTVLRGSKPRSRTAGQVEVRGRLAGTSAAGRGVEFEAIETAHERDPAGHDLVSVVPHREHQHVAAQLRSWAEMISDDVRYPGAYQDYLRAAMRSMGEDGELPISDAISPGSQDH